MPTSASKHQNLLHPAKKRDVPSHVQKHKKLILAIFMMHWLGLFLIIFLGMADLLRSSLIETIFIIWMVSFFIAVVSFLTWLYRYHPENLTTQYHHNCDKPHELLTDRFRMEEDWFNSPQNSVSPYYYRRFDQDS